MLIQKNYMTQQMGVNKKFYGKYGLEGHEGWDISTKNDRAVYSPLSCDGVVIIDNENEARAYGNYVCVWYKELHIKVWYCHLEENFVKVGETIKRGDKIGIMGNTGNSDGAHLHLHVKMVSEYGAVLNENNGFKGCVDPYPWFHNYIDNWRNCYGLT